MSNGIIARLIPLAPAMITGGPGFVGINPAFPAGNLADRQPKIVCQGAAGGAQIGIQFDVDLGADTSMDLIAIIASNVSAAGGSWSVFGFTNAGGLPAAGAEPGGTLMFNSVANNPFGVAPTTRALTRSGFLTGAAASRRWLRIYLQDNPAFNPAGIVNAGVLFIGQTVGNVFNFELGSGRKVEDQSTIRTTPGGESHADRGGKVPAWRGTWSNLTEAEMRRMWSIILEIGSSEPVLIIEDPDPVTGQAETIHYGLISSADFTERAQLDKQRIDITIREMV